MLSYLFSIYLINLHTLTHLYKRLSMEHYYQFSISVRPLSNLLTMYPLYSATFFLPEIIPFNSEQIVKTEVGARFINGCLKFSKLSNTRVEFVATCCRIGSDKRITFFHQCPNVPLL